MQASSARRAASSGGTERCRRPPGALEPGADIGHAGLVVQLVQDHLGTRPARGGHRYLDRQAGVAQQLGAVVLGDVVLLTLFLVELEEIGRAVPDLGTAAHRVEAVLVLGEPDGSDLEAEHVPPGRR